MQTAPGVVEQEVWRRNSLFLARRFATREICKLHDYPARVPGSASGGGFL